MRPGRDSLLDRGYGNTTCLEYCVTAAGLEIRRLRDAETAWWPARLQNRIPTRKRTNLQSACTRITPAQKGRLCTTHRSYSKADRCPVGRHARSPATGLGSTPSRPAWLADAVQQQPHLEVKRRSGRLPEVSWLEDGEGCACLAEGPASRVGRTPFEGCTSAWSTPRPPRVA